MIKSVLKRIRKIFITNYYEQEGSVLPWDKEGLDFTASKLPDQVEHDPHLVRKLHQIAEDDTYEVDPDVEHGPKTKRVTPDRAFNYDQDAAYKRRDSLFGMNAEFEHVGRCIRCNVLLTRLEQSLSTKDSCVYCKVKPSKEGHSFKCADCGQPCDYLERKGLSHGKQVCLRCENKRTPHISCTKCNTTLIEAEEGQELCIQCVKDSSEGLRYNEGKLPYDLIPTEAEEGLARVLAYGAKKYEARNWEKGMDWSIPYGALRRHLSAWWNGEEIDTESGLPHLAHVLCNTAFLMTYAEREVGEDNRPLIKEIDPKRIPKAAEIAKQLKEHKASKEELKDPAPGGFELERCARCREIVMNEAGESVQMTKVLGGKRFCKICARVLEHIAEANKQDIDDLVMRY